jgi:ABC-type polysaccharide/polyol phosphate export permease
MKTIFSKKTTFLAVLMLSMLALFGIGEAAAEGTSYVTAANLTTLTENFQATITSLSSYATTLKIAVIGVLIGIAWLGRFTRTGAR